MKRLKQLTALLLVLLMLCAATAVSADTYVTLNGFSFYKNDNGEAVIVGYEGGSARVEIPDSLLGAKVTEIANNAFFANSSLREVSFEKAASLRKIGNNAFCNCSVITSVALPGLTELGYGAFQGCSELQNLTIKEGLKNIPPQAFYGCNKLSAVDIPVSATSISDYAFGDCTSLQKASIPATVTSISDSAFSNCSNLEILCFKDSAAQNFAQTQGIPFELLKNNILGDADGNGIVNINDVTCIQFRLAGISVAQPERVDLLGNITKSGKLTINDATCIQLWLAGINIPYSINTVTD